MGSRQEDVKEYLRERLVYKFEKDPHLGDTILHSQLSASTDRWFFGNKLQFGLHNITKGMICGSS